MCIRPSKLSNGVLVACRKCWQCRENKVNDWVGRCIAESETAIASHSVTLTYGRDDNDNVDHLRAAVLTYSDIQKYIKLLRRHGYPCRYFAVGEYGSTKGRAHWHLMLFWQGKIPPHELAERFTEEHWPHGASFWESPNPAAIRYICKYLQKDIGKDERQGHVAMSKKPPLGDQYFRELAGRYVVQGVSPLAPYYWFNHVRGDDDKPCKFYMSGVSLDNFCQSFIDQWAAVHGGHPPHSELIEEYCDRMATLQDDFRPEPFQRRVGYPWISPPATSEIQFSEQHNAHYCVVAGERLYWSYDNEGNRSWQKEIRTEAQAELLREAARRRADPGRYSRAKQHSIL